MKASILYVELELLTIATYDTILNVGCYCGVCCLNTHEAQLVRNKVDQKLISN